MQVLSYPRPPAPAPRRKLTIPALHQDTPCMINLSSRHAALNICLLHSLRTSPMLLRQIAGRIFRLRRARTWFRMWSSARMDSLYRKRFGLRPMSDRPCSWCTTVISVGPIFYQLDNQYNWVRKSRTFRLGTGLLMGRMKGPKKGVAWECCTGVRECRVGHCAAIVIVVEFGSLG